MKLLLLILILTIWAQWGHCDKSFYVLMFVICCHCCNGAFLVKPCQDCHHVLGNVNKYNVDKYLMILL